MKDLSISFIGSGRVATQLATVFRAKNIQIRQILSRKFSHAEKLAQQVYAEAISDFSLLDDTVDLMFIVISDAEIDNVAKKLAQLNYRGCAIHTSGSTDIKILMDKNLRAGVFYPLQTFSFDCQVDWSNVPIFLETENQHDMHLLQYLAQLLSSNIYQYSSAQRLSLHLAAVFACNFSNYCYDIAQQILQQQQVDIALLQPLIIETAQKLTSYSAFQNQTGPAKRQDENILQLHQQVLKQNPEWNNIYQIMSEGIKNRHATQ